MRLIATATTACFTTVCSRCTFAIGLKTVFCFFNFSVTQCHFAIIQTVLLVLLNTGAGCAGYNNCGCKS